MVNTLPSHVCWRHSTLSTMTVRWIVRRHIYLLLAHAYLFEHWLKPPRIPRSINRPIKWQWLRTRIPYGANSFSHTWQCMTVKFLPIISCKIRHGYISRNYKLYTMRQISEFFRKPCYTALITANDSPTVSHTSSARNASDTLWWWYVYITDVQNSYLFSSMYILGWHKRQMGRIPSCSDCRNSAICLAW